MKIDWQALGLSLELASLTTVVLLLIGGPLAYLLSRSRSRLASMVEALISLPLVLPPTVLGFYLLVGLGRIHLAFTFTGLWLASIIYSLPFALQPLLASFHAIEQELFEVAWTLGDSRFRAFWRVGLPLAIPGILSGAILAFTHTLGEFGVVLMVGGNISGVTRTLSLSLYDSIEALDYDKAHATAVLLLIVSLVALIATSWFRRPITVRI